MEKRLIIAVALSLIVVAGFQFMMGKFYHNNDIPEVSKTTVAKPLDTTATILKEPEIIPSDIKEELIEIKTDKYNVTLSNIGGSIKEIDLLDYKTGDKSYVLTDTEDLKNRIFSLKGINNIDTAEFAINREDGNLIFSHKVNEKLEIVKKYNFLDNYGINLEIFFKNLSDTVIKTSYDIVGASNINSGSKFDERYTALSYKADNRITNFKNKKDVMYVGNGNINWLCMSSRYFSLTFKSFNDSVAIFSNSIGDTNNVIGIKSKELEIAPGSTVVNRYFLYAGPNDIPIINSLNIGIDDSINFGFFGGISKFLLWMMRGIHRFIPNWGLAIILLALAVNIILSPLSLTSYKSMKKMQSLQPHMEKLKKEHKNDPQKFQKEMLELYKKHKVNPMGGCLPMILQMPIFFALYNALLKSVELRGSNFLWIKDLSMPEAIKMPFTLPLLGNTFNILPILMVLAMFFQQKISASSSSYAYSEEQAQQQKIMMILFPVIFGVILYNFPSGLVLYWLTSTLFTFFQQRAIMKSV